MWKKKKNKGSFHVHQFGNYEEIKSRHHELCDIWQGAEREECCIEDPLFGYPCRCYFIEEVLAHAAQSNN